MHIRAFISTLLVCFIATNKLRADTFIYKGAKREFEFHFPRHDDKKPLPLLIALHGALGSGKGMVDFTQFNPIADRDTFMVLYPTALYGNWNDGRDGADIKSQQEHVDDIGFITALLDTIEMRYRVDKNRVYVTGISNGGMMCYALACALGGRIKAMATVVSTMPMNVYNNCNPLKPIPLLVMNGTEDPLIPWNGGELLFRKKHHGVIAATDSTVMFWVKQNHCSRTSLRTGKKDDEPNDGTAAVEYDYAADHATPDVVLYKIVGGGHTWPGGKQYLPKFIVGRVSRELDASEVIWQFFKKH